MSGRKRQSYETTFKLKSVEAAEKSSKEAAAREFKVDSKRIREWCRQKEQLLALKKRKKAKRRRLDGAGRKPRDPEMEEELFQWIVERRSRHLRVSRRMIRLQARTLSPDDEFKASRGWLQRFMKRHDLSLRRKTTVSQSVPSDVIPKLVSFILHLRLLQTSRVYSTDSIFAMDETACWMDMPGDTTIAPTGSRSVPLKTSGHEKDHFTVILTAKANGTKLKPYVVFKGKGTWLIKSLQLIPEIIVRFSSNGWMNDKLTIDYLHSILGTFSFTKRLLVWDAYRCHTSVSTRAETAKLRVHTAIVPGGCTKFIQAADVVWNTSFKAHLRSMYDTWLADETQHEFTRGGNLKAPSRSLLCEWVKAAWDAVPVDVVTNSFASCAITISTDGSEDEKIHCFKSGQPCEEGRSVLAEKMKNFGTHSNNTDDPFSSDEDLEETDNNELCIEEDDEEDSSGECSSASDAEQ